MGNEQTKGELPTGLTPTTTNDVNNRRGQSLPSTPAIHRNNNTSSNNTSNSINTRFKPMSVDVSRGVHCNLKIVIRGAQKTGKSTLFHRVQGLSFDEQYTPTPQIQVENIQWNYDDVKSSIIKVEFWDVVDHGIATEQSNKSPLPDDITSTMLLDADTVDVYRGANAVVLMFDVTREESLDYVKNHLASVPHGIPILILANFCDRIEERQVEKEQVIEWLKEYKEEKSSSPDFVFEFIRYTEASLKNGQGLDYLYRFLGVPFLASQVDTLRRQLKARAEELTQLLQSLDQFGLSNEDKSSKDVDKSIKTSPPDELMISDENAWHDTPNSLSSPPSTQLPIMTSMANYSPNGHSHYTNHMTEQEMAHQRKRRQRQGAILKHLSHASWEDDDDEDDEGDGDEEYDGDDDIHDSSLGDLSVSPHRSRNTTRHYPTSSSSWTLNNSGTPNRSSRNHYYSVDGDDDERVVRPNPLVAGDEDVEEEEDEEEILVDRQVNTTTSIINTHSLYSDYNNDAMNDSTIQHRSTGELVAVFNGVHETKHELIEEMETVEHTHFELGSSPLEERVDFPLSMTSMDRVIDEAMEPLEISIEHTDEHLQPEPTPLDAYSTATTTTTSATHLALSADYASSPVLSDSYVDNSNPWAN